MSAFAFTHAPLDRGDVLRDDPDAIARLWPTGRVLLIDAKGTAAADAQGQPLLSDGAALADTPGAAIFLGLRDGVGWFALAAEQVATELPHRVDLRQAAADWPAELSTAFSYGRAMLHWQSRTRFAACAAERLRFAVPASLRIARSARPNTTPVWTRRSSWRSATGSACCSGGRPAGHRGAIR